MPSALHEPVERAAAVDPRAPALAAGADRLDYGTLSEKIAATAAGLAGLGVRRGDRVAIALDKRVETVLAAYGTAAAGGVFVPVNPVLRAAQVGHLLRDSGAEVLVTSADRLEAIAGALEGSAVRSILLVDAREAGVRDGIATLPWAQLDDGARVRRRPIDADLAAILYTSGSTGAPKGVALTHRNLLVGAESVNGYLPNTADDVILAVLPLSFDAGFSQLTTGFDAGAEVVLHNYLLPRDVVRACLRHGVTALTAVPPLWSQLAGLDWSEAGPGLRYFANTGGRMPATTLAALRADFPNAAPYLMYGLTEAFRSTFLDPAEVDRRPDSIGTAIPNAEVLVVRPDGTECEPGETGELVHRGALVAAGYWNDPVRTAERFRPLGPTPDWRTVERAVWSGDLARRDEEGYLYFVARGDEMIKTSGYRVSPSEVEEAALRTGLVRDAVAFGTADEALGQRIVLIVTAVAPGAAEPLRAALARELPRFMVPASIVEVEEVPRSPNGKYDRARLTKEYVA